MFKNRHNRNNWFARRQLLGNIHFKDGDGDSGNSGDSNSSAGDNSGDNGIDIEAKIQAAVDEATTGLRTKNQELINTLKTAQDQAKKYEGVDIEALTSLQKQVEQDEILSLMTSGKSQEALDKATEKLRVTHSAEMKKIQDEYESFKSQATEKDSLIEKLLLTDKIGDAFINEGGYKEAKFDAIARAREVWKVEGQEIIARDEKGNIIQGEDGPLTIKEWLASMKKTAPHFFPRSAGDVDLPSGEMADGMSAQDRLILAAKKGPAALRAEKDRQAKK